MNYFFEGSIDKSLHKRGFPDPLPSNDEDITGGHLSPPSPPESHFSPGLMFLSPSPGLTCDKLMAALTRKVVTLHLLPLSHGQRSIA